MARKRLGWFEAFTNALQQENVAVMQLATIDSEHQHVNTPRVRSLVYRGFLTSNKHSFLPLLLSTTDIRASKVEQLHKQRDIELVYWASHIQEQFRIYGRASIVPAHGYNASQYPAVPEKGLVYEALEEEGFDWEKKRMNVFDAMSAHMKATWCRPVPGTPLEGGEEVMKTWPATLPKLGEAASEAEKCDLAVALSNFALLVVEPFEVDYVELGVLPNRRTRFVRENERSVEFRDILVVP